eukprot:scaffold427_cov263-Pinguiococcus_pyrenoidosus.AAC.8
MLVIRVLIDPNVVYFHGRRQALAVLEQRRQRALAVLVLAIEAAKARLALLMIARLRLAPKIVHRQVQDDLHRLEGDARPRYAIKRVPVYPEDLLVVQVPADVPEAHSGRLPLYPEKLRAAKVLFT